MALSSRTFESMRPWLLAVVAVLVAAVGVFIVITTFALNQRSSFERTWIRQANALQVDSLRLSKAAVESSLGNLDAFRELAQVHLRMFAQMQALELGSPADGLPPVTDDLPQVFADLKGTWESVSEDAQLIIDSDTRINRLAGASNDFLTAIPAIQADTDRMVGQLIESGSPSPQVFAASRQLVLADRMQRRALEILQNAGDSTATAAELGQEIALFEQVLYALRNGNARMGITPVRNPQASSSLNQVRRQYEAVKPQLEVILEASQNLLDIRQAADRIFSESDRMFDHARTLAVAIAELPQERFWPSSRANTAALGLLIVLALVLLVLVMITASRRADTAVRHNRKTQQAIIKLLDDLGALGEGDLTVRADVTDEITGAIADGVNYAVEQLRGLVLGVNETAQAVADSADTTRRATERLAASADEQAGHVVRATEKVQSMSSAFGAMADRSRKSRDTALESVEAAHSGAERVRETITGMDRIREQIQETSKRIKRLGESTQEIGDIVKMINDIAEQTNVLALNAAIQAASAGSSGQGFGMVADEVQQLAESATSATRRISTLVETIQIDTGEAIKSMEQTTSEVVNGARLAKDAGGALVQIEESSNELSTLIRDISREAAQHSEQAQRISDLMDGIRDVSMRTSEGSTQTADAVAELADLVLQLRESVSHFKLPGTDTADPAKEPAT